MTLSPFERHAVESFIARADKISNSRMIRAGFAPSLSIKFESGEVEIVGSEVDEEYLDAVLTSFRPFLMNSEGVYLDSIFELIERVATDVEVREEAQLIHEHHQARLGSEFIRIEHGGKSYGKSEIYKLVVNSRLAHDDLKKAQTLKSLGSDNAEIVTQLFYSFIHSNVITILDLRQTLKKLLDAEG